MRFYTSILRALQLTLITALPGLAAVDFVVNPYLRLLEKDRVVVSFEFDAPASGAVLYGTNTARLDQAVPFTQNTFHALQLTNLTPDTAYHYQIALDSGEEINQPDKQYFKTRSLQSKPFTFAVYGDVSSGIKSYDLNHGWVLQSILNETFPEFAVITGDIINDGNLPQNWHRFFELESELTRTTPIYGVMGNNEAMNASLFKKYFLFGDQQEYYSFNHNDCHFIVLNVLRGMGKAYYDGLRPGSPQLQWLLNDLQSEANTQAKFTFVFLHAPLFSPDGRGDRVVAELFHPLFKKYGVDLVFSGTHSYSRAEKDGVVYFITGGGGAEMRETPVKNVPEIKENANIFHHLRVYVEYPVVMTDVVDLRSSIYSSYTYWSPDAKQKDSVQTASNTTSRSTIQTAVLDNEKRSIPISIFSLPSCGYCKDLIEKTIPRMAENMDVNIPIDYHSLNDAENFEKLVQLEYQLNDKDNELPVVIIGNTLLGGKDEIHRELQKQILLYTKENQPGTDQAPIDAEQAIQQKFESFKILPIILAGLLDGINPCAFTTIIFLLSYLIYLGKGKKEVLIAGLAFSVGVFLTYMVIGLGFSELLSSIRVYGRMADIIKYTTFTLVLILGLLNLRDAIKIKQGKEGEISLKLPKVLRRKIQDRVKVQTKKSKLILGSFTLGFFVSTFELACTGQMYVPTLIYMLQISNARLKAFSYLLLYNLMFILPLILVFLAVYFGLARDSVVRLFRSNLFFIKLVTMFIFLGLALFILFI